MTDALQPGLKPPPNSLSNYLPNNHLATIPKKSFAPPTSLVILSGLAALEADAQFVMVR